MANVKISALTSATFVNDADLIPIVQSGVTKKVTPAILLENLWAETTAINGLIDGILAAPSSPSPYTASGTLFNNGVASSRVFSFKTDRDLTYNPSTAFTDLHFGKNVDASTGILTSELGGLCIQGSNNGTINFSPAAITIAQYNIASSNLFQIQLTPFKTEIQGGTTTGIVRMEIGVNGLLVTDGRSTPLGFTYNGNYTATIIANDRAVPDVGTVKQLITANAASIYTASGNVFHTGIASTRRFDFQTSQDAGYNPSGENIRMTFNAYSDYSNNVLSSPGTFGIKAQQISNVLRYASINMYSASETIELLSTDISVGERRTITVSPEEVNIYTNTSTGNVQLLFNGGGGWYVDNRTPKLGFRYNADYSNDLLTVDRAMTDVGTVKKLRQQANTWTTGTRPAAVAGVFGLNTTTSKFEGYTGSAWVDFH
jgi:hypothetical protein